jgi:curved DNA-binding protein CbpA
MNGLLREHPLVELFREMKTSQMGGALRLTHDRYKCVVYLSEGDVQFTTSNLKSHRLRECVLRWKIASTPQLADLNEALSDVELSAELLSRGIVDSTAMGVILGRQSEEVLRPALLWTEGEWSYDPRVRLSNMAGVRFDASEVMFEAARRLPPTFSGSRFPSINEVLTRVDANWDSRELKPAEAFLLTRLENPMRVYELVALSGLPELETLRTAYCLYVSGIVQRSNPLVVFEPEVVSASKQSSAEKTRLITLEAPPKPEKTVSAPPEAVSEEVLRRELDALFARIESAQSHYEVLDLGRAADAGEVKRVYYAHARKFHPDRFRHHGDPELHGRVEAAFARIAQAYETLRTPNLRVAYDSKLDALRRTAGMQSNVAGAQPLVDLPKKSSHPAGSNSTGTEAGGANRNGAEESFARGLEAMNSGNFAFAAAAFSEAVKLAPKEARFRAYYGRALGARQQTRRQAEAEILSAIAMEKNNPLFHIMLAEVYQNINLYRRALTSVETALSLDPNNELAKGMKNRLRDLTNQPARR